MKLSVIIVNYNVEHFLEQCLNSVLIAAKKVDTEIIVVDNNSVDGSIKMMQQKFPELHLIANLENLGFSKANNQAIRIANGEYILLLNPDTLVEADTFKKVVDFMDSHPEAGGLGVKMLDGKGNFLPESKRGLPTPGTAFFKMFGLSKLFPKSKLFSKYHLGFLNEDEVNEVEVLSGAFMLMRKSTLNEVGLLDEAFFMYGEDIDLSYRILKGGYKNYYFPETRIIHYKGESTKKDSVNYVYVFYKAMVIFAKKHFSKNNANAFAFLINTAIVFRALLSLVMSFIRKAFVPLIDLVVSYFGLFIISNFWALHYSTHNTQYPKSFFILFLPFFLLILLLTNYYSGTYDKPLKFIKILKANAIGFLIVVSIYALMPETIRFSRMMALSIPIWWFVSTVLVRFIAFFLGFKEFKFGKYIERNIGIIGDFDEVNRVKSLLEKTSIKVGEIALINASSAADTRFIGNLNQLEELIKIYRLQELIFCSKNLTSACIIDQMMQLQSSQVDYKIAPPETLFIIGSNSINTSNDIYLIEVNSINKPENKRIKRLFDFVFSSILIALLPVIILFYTHKFNLIKNLISVWIGNFSFVGFDKSLLKHPHNFPSLKKSILYPSDAIQVNKTEKNIETTNAIYAKNYTLYNDFSILFQGLSSLNRMI